MAKKFGLYLGLNSVGAVTVENKKITATARFDLSSLEEEAKVENLSEDIRWEALVNKTLREIGAEDKNIHVSLSDKDFIFRSLEMPLMDKKSIASSLSYEIERYIPFKIDELWWDYDVIRYPKEKKMYVSFVGIRENTILRTQELLAHLGLNPVILEPASLSLVKIVKLAKKYTQVKNFAILDVTEFEAYLTFFYQDMPVFNQYIVVPKGQEGFDFDKFIESVRFAFQYFKREFKYYDLEKLIVVSGLKEEKLSLLLKEELQIETELFSPLDVTTSPGVDVEGLKAFGAAYSAESSYKFKPVLKKTEISEEKQELAVSETPSLRIGLLLALAGLGAVGCILLSVFFNNEENTLKYNLEKINKEIYRPEAIKNLSWKQIDGAIVAAEKKLKILEELGKARQISPSLAKVSSLRPKGLWFNAINAGCSKNKCKLAIEGDIFLGDPYQERANIDEFVSRLKADSTIKLNFSSIDMTGTEKKTVGEYTFTHFSLKME